MAGREGKRQCEKLTEGNCCGSRGEGKRDVLCDMMLSAQRQGPARRRLWNGLGESVEACDSQETCESACPKWWEESFVGTSGSLNRDGVSAEGRWASNRS